MRSLSTAALSLVLCLAGSTAFADVRVSIRDGRVSIVATDATVAEILAEWSRIGQTKVVNAERLSAERMTLQLQGVTEEQALDVVLRATSGYMVALRSTDAASASRFDRIVLMPPSIAPKVEATAAARTINAAASYAPPAYEVAGSQPAPADESAEGTPTPPQSDPVAVMLPDGPPSASPDGAVAPAPAAIQKTFSTRHAIETVNPREFKLPPGLPGGNGVVAPGATRAPAGVLPGVIVQPPKPRPPGGAEDQPPGVHG